MPEGFGFILNLLEYSGPLPVDILPGVSFNLATDKQKQEIARFLQNQGTMGGIGGTGNYYAKPRFEMPTGSWDYEKLSPDEIKFWVLNYQSDLNSLEIPFLLIEPEIEWGATFYKRGMGIDLPKLFHHFQTHLFPIFALLSIDALKEVQQIHSHIAQSKDSKHQASASLLRVLQDFATARSYIRISHMALLSHFSLIEALITHEPQGNRRGLVKPPSQHKNALYFFDDSRLPSTRASTLKATT
jgi:hypothetical protein